MGDASIKLTLLLSDDVSLNWKGWWSFGCRQIRLEAPKAKLARLIELTKGYLHERCGYLTHHCFHINRERDVTFYAAVVNVDWTISSRIRWASFYQLLFTQPVPEKSLNSPKNHSVVLTTNWLWGVLRSKKVRNSLWTQTRDSGSFKIYTYRGKETLSRSS